VKRVERAVVISIVVISLIAPVRAGEVPRIRMENGAGQLVVNGRAFLILGAELGNSSAGTAAEADTILPKLTALHVNTVLMPVTWEQLEPTEGKFDFSIVDHWTATARAQHLHVVLLWFGSWKNGFSNYAPEWVKADTKRFPRAEAVDGKPLEILSTLSSETRAADSRAFAALLRHVRETDAQQQTVLMVQVENEVGYFGPARDRSAEANRVFHANVPDALLHSWNAKRLELSPELAAHFNEHGKTWSEVFGDAADEAFMAWKYASYIEAVAHAGKAEYALPMYVNAQLPAPFERAGEYPSGGPHPYFLEVWRAAAPSLDFFSPDIYWPNFEYWMQRYAVAGNALFVPEARLDVAAGNALYAYGQARAFGFSPFAIESLAPAKDGEAAPPIAQVYASLDSVRDILTGAQAAGATRGLVLHATSPRPTQTVALGGYLFEAALARTWPARTLAAEDGAMLVMQAAADEFYVLGMGLSVNITRDPDTDSAIAGIASVEQVARVNGGWMVERRLNGDQTDQGRRLLMDAKTPRWLRVRMYTVGRN